MLRLTPGFLRFYGPVASQALQLYRELYDHVTLPHEIKRQGQGYAQANLLRHAYRYSSFWRQRLSRTGFDVGAPEQFELTHLPVLTRQDLQESFEAMRARWPSCAANYKPAYCNRFLVLLGFCFNLAIKWDITGVIKNPVKDVERLKANNKIERFLKQDEALRLLQAIQASPNQMLQYFVPLALLTGARKRELLDARWEDIDFNRRVWRIPMTKSGRPRHVPLTNEAVEILTTLRSRLPQMLEQPELIENPWVLPNLSTGKPFQSIFNSWNTARIKAGVSDLRVHDLRHSFASALVNQGIPIYDIQKLLGHQDIKTTERYAHLAPDRLRASASAAGEVYSMMLPLVENP